MSNPSKRKGTSAEVALLAWLHGNGHPEAVRNPPAGVKDVGDLRCEVGSGGGDWYDHSPVVIEVKSYRDIAAAINTGLAELDVEMANAASTHGVLVVKRRGKGDPGEWLAIRKVRNDPELGASCDAALSGGSALTAEEPKPKPPWPNLSPYDFHEDA